MKLAPPTRADEAAVMDYRQEFLFHHEEMLGAAGLENYECYADWLAHTEANRCEHTVHPDLPPATTLLCWADETLAGTVEIRHRLTDFQLAYTGHIGFSLRRSCRGQRLAVQLLSLALEECRKLGLGRILLTCKRFDTAARSAIERNGGMLENEIAYEGDIRCRYWITIPLAYCRTLQPEELDRELFSAFDRRQEVTLCRRRIGVSWHNVSCPFVDDWTEEQWQKQIHQLQSTLRSGGAVFGAFMDGRIKGFCAVAAKPLGPGGTYRDLLSLHVSADCRGKGLGRMLFGLAAQWAWENGASKLYISAHSAVETQAFYAAMGCVDTPWPDPEHVALEPFDCQLEYSLHLFRR